MPFLAAIPAAIGLSTAAAGGAAAATGAAATIGAGVTAAGLGSGAIGTGLTAAGLASAGAASGLTTAAAAGGGFLATAANAINAIGTIGSLASSLMSNNANASAAQAQASAAQRKAKIDESNYRYEARHTLGKQAAMLGASGVSGSSGTPMDVMLESAYNAELNARRIGYGGRLEASGYRADASRSRGRNFGVIGGGLADAGKLIGKFLS